MKILISQKAPANKTSYDTLTEKYGVCFEFKPFFLIEPLNAKEFRTQRINLAEFTAVTFSSRHAIDAYFSLCEEMRIKVPDTMKYFCTTELVAMYLQKHIVYRKRKIFFGDGTAASIMSLIGSKHKDEKFLITSSDSSNVDNMTVLFDEAGISYETAVVVKSVSQDIKNIKLEKYDLVALYSSHDIKSLYENFPEFKQGNIKFLAYGKSISKAMEAAGLTAAVSGPTPEAPSVAKTIELYLESNK